VNIERLVTMANDIANFFVAEAGPDGAPEQVATHLRKFWDPRMRAQLADYAQHVGTDLSPAALAAARLLATSPAPEVENQ
jgi:formate dehydrogenase subunit delta